MNANASIQLKPAVASVSAAARGLSGSATDVGLSLRFILMGIACLLAGILLLLLRPDILATYHYNQFVVATTHLLVLGWISSIVMGALYQLVPVALETRLYSPRLAAWHFAFHLVGVTGMVWMFWAWQMKQVECFGSIFAVGVGLFVFNLARTLWQAKAWNLISAAVLSALGWLVVTVAFGLFLAASKAWSLRGFAALAQMHAHAHLGVIGFFVMMTVGISYKLVPMFTLGELQSERRAWVSLGMLNAGLAGLVPTILLESRYKFLCAMVCGAGLAFYGAEIWAIVRARKRRSLDWGIKYFLTALGLLVPLAALGLTLAWPALPLNPFTGQLENVYGFVALFGVLSFAILGMLYKIVPFLVWYARYSNEIGRGKVPTLAELYSARVQAWGYWLFGMGLSATSGAVLVQSTAAVRGGCALLAASLLLFAGNIGTIINHLLQPRIEPIPAPRPIARTAAA